MTIEEAIAHCKEEAEKLRKDSVKRLQVGLLHAANDCEEYESEDEQLAEWLEEQKQRREAGMMIDSEILKSRIGELCLNNDDMFSAKAYERIIGVIEAVPTEPKVNRAEILRLLHEIESDATTIAYLSDNQQVFDCSHAILDRVELIGKEMNGDA